MLNPHLFLPDNSRQQIIDFLVDKEKFGLFGIQQQGGKPYFDTATSPRLTIGYGFNLEGDPIRLQLVLDQIYAGASPAAVAQFKNGLLSLVNSFRPSRAAVLSRQGSLGYAATIQAAINHLAQQNGLGPFEMTPAL